MSDTKTKKFNNGSEVTFYPFDSEASKSAIRSWIESDSNPTKSETPILDFFAEPQKVENGRKK